MKMTFGQNNLFFLPFPDLNKNYIKSPDYSRFSPACKFSRLSMNPVRVIGLKTESIDMNRL